MTAEGVANVADGSVGTTQVEAKAEGNRTAHVARPRLILSRLFAGEGDHR